MTANDDRILFFDIDGTLIHSGAAGSAALDDTLSAVLKIENPDTDIDYGGRTDLGIMRELMELNKIKYSSSLEKKLLEHYVDELKKWLPQKDGKVLPGVVALLDHLRDLPGFQSGLITGNIRQGAFAKLAQFNLDHYFAFGGFGDREIKREDIVAEGLREATSSLGRYVDKDKCLIIGDTPRDVACARAHGIKVLIVTTGFASPKSLLAADPDYLVDDLSDREQIMQILSSF